MNSGWKELLTLKVSHIQLIINNDPHSIFLLKKLPTAITVESYDIIIWLWII